MPVKGPRFNAGSQVDPCFDYANQGTVNGADYSIFARAFNRPRVSRLPR